MPDIMKRLAAGLLATVAVAGLGLAGCGGTDGSKSTASIGSFSLIEVGKTHVQVAADGTSAVVEVERARRRFVLSLTARRHHWGRSPTTRIWVGPA